MADNSKKIISFQHSFMVKPTEIDGQNHVNNVVYLKWINDISVKHWKILASNIVKKKYSWVAKRHEIDYLKSALLQDEITVKTWIEEYYGATSVRMVEIYANDKLLAKSKTIWVLLNSQTKRVTRINNEILETLKLI